MMGRLIIVRHGQAEGNSEHRFIGQSDVALDRTGHQQARVVADRLGGAGVDRIVSSDLSRTLDTIRPLAEACNLPIETDPRLREIDNGEWTGFVPDELEQRWPEMFGRYREGEDVPRPGGEQWGDVRRRVVDAVGDLIAAGLETTVVCTHGGPVVLTAAWAAGIELPGNPFRGPFGPAANTGLTVISTPEPRLVAYNDVGHLGPQVAGDDRPYLPT